MLKIRVIILSKQIKENENKITIRNRIKGKKEQRPRKQIKKH